MFNRRECLSSLAALALASNNAGAADASPRPRFRRGLNFHGNLNWPSSTKTAQGVSYMWPPFSEPRFALKRSVLQDVKAAGFDFIRLTVSPDIFLASDATRRRQLFTIARNRVDMILTSGLSVLFDLHPVVLNPDFAPDKLESPASPAFKAYLDLVRQTAGFLKDMDGNKVAFELMNEPSLHRPGDMQRWPAMLAQLHDAARMAAPDLTLMLSGANWGDRLALQQIDVARYRASNVLYTFHYYDPHVYTHQGYSREDDVQYLSGLAWPENLENVQQVRTDALQRIAQDPATDAAAKASLTNVTAKALDGFEKGHFNEQRIKADFMQLAQWAQSNGIAKGQILLGEFGALAAAAGKPSPGRLAWIKAVRENAETAGFSWAFWVYEGYHSFGLATPTGGLDREVLNALGLIG